MALDRSVLFIVVNEILIVFLAKRSEHLSSKFQLTAVYLLYNLPKRCDVKQSEELKENVAPAMFFDVYIFSSFE